MAFGLVQCTSGIIFQTGVKHNIACGYSMYVPSVSLLNMVEMQKILKPLDVGKSRPEMPSLPFLAISFPNTDWPKYFSRYSTNILGSCWIA